MTFWYIRLLWRRLLHGLARCFSRKWVDSKPRHFNRGHATITRLLTKPLKRDAVWNWRDEEQGAFTTLRDALMNRSVLSLFKYGREIEKHTDASALVIVGMIVQRQEDGKLYSVAYYRRQTSYSASRYHCYEPELLAVLETVTKYRGYLLGT